MSEQELSNEDRQIQRWGGRGGILGSIAFVACFAVAMLFVGTDVAEPTGFPGIRGGRTVEDALYLAVYVLWILHYAAMHRGGAERPNAPALFGRVLGVAGSVVLAAGTLPHLMTLRLSDVYQADPTPEMQAQVDLAWIAVYGVFDALLVVGLILSTIGAALLSVAMARRRHYSTVVRWTCISVSTIGAAASIVLLWEASFVAIVPLLMLTVFHAVAGASTLRIASGRTYG